MTDCNCSEGEACTCGTECNCEACGCDECG